MMKSKIRTRKTKGIVRKKIEKIVKCLQSEEELVAADEMTPSSESLATKDYIVDGYSEKLDEADHKPDNRNIEEAELSLRERGSLNYEEARALLGRIEYQKGNVEAALHVFEGIDIAAVTPKMKLTLARRAESNKRHSKHFSSPPMSLHAVSLLLEAIFLKAKSLQHLGRYQEAALCCKVVLDVVESSLPEGLPQNLASDCKLQDTLDKAVELLPELWKLADSPNDAILSYRRALLHHWNLDPETTARIQKQFAIFLLYSGGEATPPNLRSQMDSSFVPRNNIEEAILLLMILLRKVYLNRIEWDVSILDHLSFALSIAGDLKALANQIEGLLPGIIDRKEMYQILALCYHGAGEELVALNLLRKLLHRSEDPKCIPALLVASEICGRTPNLAEEGIQYARRALECLDGGCDQLGSVANYLLGISLSTHAKSVFGDSERVRKQSEAIQVLETAGKITYLQNFNILYHLSLEYAEQRKLDAAIYYAKMLLKVDNGSSIKGWLLLARILSAQKRFTDAESVISAALDQTGNWDQGELLRTKAKLQVAQGLLKDAIDTYTHLLAILQIKNKSFSSTKKPHKHDGNSSRHLELEVWHDLASVYVSLSRWHDAEVCLSKSKAISSYSAARCHITGVLCKEKGLLKEAVQAYLSALAIDPVHVPSLVSAAVVLTQFSNQSKVVIRSFLMQALQLDRTNHCAWYNLGLLYKSERTASSSFETADCFEAAAFLEDTAPVEPFR